MLRQVFASVLCFAPTAVLADAPRVVADIAPVHSIVAQVMAGVGEPDLLVSPGVSPHGYSMRPSEASALSKADLVFYVDEGLTPWLMGPMENLADGASRLALMQADGVTRFNFRETAVFGGDDHHDEEHGHDDHDDHKDHKDEHAHDDHGHEEHAHDDEHEEESHEDHADGHDHDHDHGADTLDPHGWLDPENGKLWAGLIADELSARDPENADTYRANADQLIAEIDAAASGLSDALSDAGDKGFIVFHDAYQYFENRFGLNVLGAISLSDASAPSPARLADLRDVVAEAGVQCAFTEPQFDTGLIEAVIPAEGVRLAQLDPQGVDVELGAGLYVALLQNMGTAMAECLVGE